MIAIQQNSKIKCFKLTDSHNIVQTSPQSLINTEDEELVLVEMSMLGIDHVYSLMTTSKRKHFNKDLELAKNKESVIQISRVIGDSPVVDKVNIFSNTIQLKDLSLENWISLYQMDCIFEGMNTISEMELDTDVSYQLDSDIFRYSIIDFCHNVKFKYIIWLKNDKYVFANDIVCEKYNGIFVYIPEFQCWQYVSKKKWQTLSKISSIELHEAIITSHLSCSEVTYQQEYYASNLLELIKYSIYIIVDLKIREMFNNSPEYFYLERDQKAALEVKITVEDQVGSALFTFEELHSTFKKFSILKLINNLICLKP